MLNLDIVIGIGPFIGKPPISKKLPNSTSVIELKNLLSGIIQVPVNDQIIYYKTTSNDPLETLDEDHKSLIYYGLKDKSMIIVNSIKL